MLSATHYPLSDQTELSCVLIPCFPPYQILGKKLTLSPSDFASHMDARIQAVSSIDLEYHLIVTC